MKHISSKFYNEKTPNKKLCRTSHIQFSKCIWKLSYMDGNPCNKYDTESVNALYTVQLNTIWKRTKEYNYT